MKERFKILNVGCGNDTYGTHFVDLYPYRKEVKKCDVNKQELPFPSNFFDIVYSKNLFEHLTNPEFALKEMKRVLKNNGKIILITDYAHAWNYAVGRVHLGGYEKTSQKEDRHYLLVNDWHLENWFRKVGLKTLNIEFIEDDYVGNNFFKKNIKRIVNKILHKTPFWRMGYTRIKIIGTK
ncbi:MAG: methyltransferase domain-containing protein [Candidatus Aenigmatarchaeota archaeon]